MKLLGFKISILFPSVTEEINKRLLVSADLLVDIVRHNNKCNKKVEDRTKDIRLIILWLLRPHEGLRHFHRHLLPSHGSSPFAIPFLPARLLTCDSLLFDIAAYFQDIYAVRLFQVVFNVQFVEGQRHPKGGISGWEEWGTDECNDKVGSGVFLRIASRG